MPATLLTALNVTVIMATIFFLLSTLASHLTEIVSGLRDARGKTLEKQLSAALTAPVADEILADPVIRSFAKSSRGWARESDEAKAPKAGQMPSYITPASFARAVARNFATAGTASAKSDVFIELMRDAGQRAITFDAAVIEWFGQFNDRITGTYRRNVTLELLALGFFLAVALDIDIVHLGQYLWANPGATAKTASELAANFAKIQAANSVADAQALAGHGTELAKTLAANLNTGAFGWQQWRPVDDIGWWLAKLLGWFLAAVGTSFGAQFWFQILNSSLKIRLVGPQPDAPQEEARADTNWPETSPAPLAPLVDTAAARGAFSFASLVTRAPASPLLGVLSEKYEVGSRGPGAVSSGVGDPGGVSYGSYQMTSKPDGGTVKTFVAGLPAAQKAQFDTLPPGSAAFSAAWKKLAAEDASGFFTLQHDFIRRTHYEPLCATVSALVDIATRSFALQNVVWSTAVQHGAHTPILELVARKFNFAAGSVDEIDAMVIKGIYAERGRKLPNGTLVYFTKSSPQVQAGVAARFVAEQKDALQMLAEESEPAMVRADA